MKNEIIKKQETEVQKSKPPKIQLVNNCFKIEDQETLKKIGQSLGTLDEGVLNRFMNQVVQTDESFQINLESSANVILSILYGMSPKNEMEAMLAMQMIGAHNLAMRFMRGAMIKDQPPEFVEMHTNRAAKLMKVYCQQMELFNRMKGMSQQKVVVEHVHVHQGGQAIVGAVTSNQGVGGTKDGFKE